MAKHKYIESPEALLEYWKEYKASLPDILVPVTHARLGVVEFKIPQPIHEKGFNVYMQEVYDMGTNSVHRYFGNDEAYKEYRSTITRIKDDIFTHSIKYSSVRMHDVKLAMSLLGLADRTDNKTEHSGTINANFGSPIIQPPPKSETDS